MTRCESFELLRNIKLTSWLDRTKMCPRLEKYGECRIEKKNASTKTQKLGLVPIFTRLRLLTILKKQELAYLHMILSLF
jgi:hypothetical protein